MINAILSRLFKHARFSRLGGIFTLSLEPLTTADTKAHLHLKRTGRAMSSKTVKDLDLQKIVQQ
jgi:hypothetical protein